VTGGELADLLEAHGYDFFTGVPCSLIESLIAALEMLANKRDRNPPKKHGNIPL